MEVTKLFEILQYQKAKHPQEVALAGKVGGKWKTYSTDDCIEMANKVSRGLIAMGIQPGDMIGIISGSRPEWHFCDIGIMQAGAIPVPLYPTISSGEYEYIFNHAELKIAIIGDAKILGKVMAIKDKIPSLREIFTFDEIEGTKHFTDLLRAGEKTEQAEVEKRKAAVKPDDLATIIYTSGTTGNPKGVMLSHNNIVSNVQATIPLLPIEPGNITLSFLPLCHIFERMVLFVYTYSSMSVYFCDSIDNLRDYIGEVKPEFFTAVPRVVEKLYERIIATGNEQTGLKKKIFFWAMGLADKYKIDQDMGFFYNMQLNLAKKLVFGKIVARLGGRVKGIVTGASALPAKLCRVFNAMGVPIREGYGMTELSPAVSFNRFEPGGVMDGTVGIKISNVAVKIAEGTGEILVKGPNVMMGYYKNPEATAETIDKDGWLHTGDVGVLSPEGFLKITDRIKELFKTSGGKYIAPQPIETKMKESFFIEQMMVVGEAQKFPAALVVPAFPFLKSWCAENGIPFDDNNRQASLQHPQIQAKYKEIIAHYNQDFGQWEQIKKFELVPDEWTVDSGEMTPTMKLKRRIILQKYQKQIEGIFA